MRVYSLILVGLLLLTLTACTDPTAPNGDTGGKDDGLVLDLESVTRAGAQASIFAVQGSNGADSGVPALIELMGAQGIHFYKTDSHPQGLIARDDVVILKFNCQWAQRGGTNTDLIKSVVEAILQHPQGFTGEVIIADNGQAQYGSHGRGGSIDWPDNNALDRSQSVRKVAEGFSGRGKVSALTWDSITTIKVEEYSSGDYQDGYILFPEKAATGFNVSYPKFKTQFGTYVSFKEGIWDSEANTYDSERLKVINMPVLKSHRGFQVTASVKNYMGVVSDKLTGGDSHRSVISGGMGTQMAETRLPVLNLLDAIWINPYPGRGPSTGYTSAVQTNIIAASTDPAALDAWAAKNILMAAATKLKISGNQVMDPHRREPGFFGYWLSRSVEELRSYGFTFTINEDEMSVYIQALD